MKRIPVLMLFAATLAACNSDSEQPNHQTPAPDNQPGRTDNAYRVSMKNTCMIEADQCRGGYGFTVTSNREYEIGPGPDGELWTGSLTEEEVAPLTQSLGSLVDGITISLNSDSNCTTMPDDAGALQTISFTQRGSSHELVTVDGAHICYRRASVAEAIAIRADLSDLVNRHYALPFPNPCFAVGRKLEEQFAPFAACETDSDCAYVDIGFTPIIPDVGIQAVVTDDCTWLKPLVAANASLLTLEEREQLQKARSDARAACGADLNRGGSCKMRHFQASASTPASCRAGVCRTHPSMR